MNELLFPLGTILLLSFVIIPLLSILTQIRIGYLQQHHPSFEKLHTNRLLFWLLLPTALPIVWIVFSVVHLGYSDVVHTSHESICLLNHHQFWTDEAILLVIMMGIALILSIRIYLEELNQSRVAVIHNPILENRIRKIRQTLSIGSESNVLLIKKAKFAAQSIGIIQPKVLLSEEWVEQIDDDMLEATLLHEFAHHHAGDLWTGACLKLGILMNPSAKRLQPSTAIWLQSRELMADQKALYYGANPLALAQSIVNAIRWQREQTLISNQDVQFCLSPSNTSLLKLRLLHLTDSTSSTQSPSKSVSVLWMLGLVCILSLPHLLSIDLLDSLHYGIEVGAQYIGVLP